MEQADWVEELEAQIETHGIDMVVFELVAENPQHTELVITNVQFTDSKVVVSLEAA